MIETSKIKQETITTKAPNHDSDNILREALCQISFRTFSGLTQRVAVGQKEGIHYINYEVFLIMRQSAGHSWVTFFNKKHILYAT